MASTDARPIPIKNTAFRVMFPILDNTGSPVSGAAGLDSEISKDQGTFADCTNEATEIATSSGIYYLDLTSTEMNADGVAVIVKTSTTDAKTTVLVFYPQELGDIKVDAQSLLGTVFPTPSTAGIPNVNITQISGTGVTTSAAQIGVNVVNINAQTATASGAVTFPGTIASPTNITAGTVTTATNVTTVNGLAANVITAAATAADFGTEIGTAVWATGTRALTTLAGLTVDTVTTLTNLPAITANWLTAAGLAADAVTEIQSGLATAAELATVAGYLDTEIAAIKAKTDQLTSFDFVTFGTRGLTMLVVDGAVYQYTANALELAPSGSGLTAQQTRDAMKLAPSVGAAAAGSIDDQIADLQTSVDALAAGSGTGAYTITVTVTDGTDPLENASVRLIEGVTPYTGNTNASGEAVFALDAATYAVAVTKAGYQFTPTTRTVTGEEAGTLTNDLEMTEVVVAPPADATLCRVFAYLQTKSGAPVTGQTMTAKLTTPAKSDAMITTATITSAVSDADGLVFLDLLLPSDITPAGLKYLIEIPTANFKEEVTPTGATYSLGQLIT